MPVSGDGVFHAHFRGKEGRACPCSRYRLGRARFFAEFTSPFGVTTPPFTSYFDNHTARPTAMRCEGVNSQTVQYANRCPRPSECDDATLAFWAAVRLFAFLH